MTGAYVIAFVVGFVGAICGLAWWLGRRDGARREQLKAAARAAEVKDAQLDAALARPGTRAALVERLRERGL